MHIPRKHVVWKLVSCHKTFFQRATGLKQINETGIEKEKPPNLRQFLDSPTSGNMPCTVKHAITVAMDRTVEVRNDDAWPCEFERGRSC